MRNKTLVVVLIIVGFLVAAGVAARTHGGGSFSKWLASLHGTRGH